ETERAANALERYKVEHQLIAVDETQTAASVRLEELSKQLVAAQARRVTAEGELAAAKQAGTSVSERTGGYDQFWVQGQLYVQLAQLEAERASLSDRLKPDHPQVVALERRLAAARERLAQAGDLAFAGELARLQ